jgi:hypothetical protein
MKEKQKMAIANFMEEFFGEAYKLVKRPWIGIYAERPVMLTPEQALEHMKRADEIGVILINIWAKPREEVEAEVERLRKMGYGRRIA